MAALMVYETFFGGTETIVEAVAQGIGSRMDVEVVDVAEAPTMLPDHLELLVVGVPAYPLADVRTLLPHMRMSRPRPAPGQVGIDEWLEALEVGRSRPINTLVFETRVRGRRVPSTGAYAVERALRRKGIGVSECPRPFYVVGSTCLAAEGERARARGWGEQIADEIVALGFWSKQPAR